MEEGARKPIALPHGGVPLKQNLHRNQPHFSSLNAPTTTGTPSSHDDTIFIIGGI